MFMSSKIGIFEPRVEELRNSIMRVACGQRAAVSTLVDVPSRSPAGLVTCIYAEGLARTLPSTLATQVYRIHSSSSL